MRDDDPADPLDLARSVARGFAKGHRGKPERGFAIARDDVDMRRFVRVLILVGVEEEPVRPEPVDDGQAARLDRLAAGTRMMAIAASPALTRP